MPKRVGDDGDALAVAHRHSVAEVGQLQGGDVHLALHSGVGGIQHLETPVAAEAVDDVGAHPAAEVVGGLQDPHLGASPGELASALQAGQPGPDHDDFGVHGAIVTQIRAVGWLAVMP